LAWVSETDSILIKEKHQHLSKISDRVFFEVQAVSIMTQDTVFCVLFMLSVANKHSMLSVVMLNVVAPLGNLSQE
jgi:hypothetical protein